MDGAPKSTVRRDIAFICAVCICLLAPFIAKPLHMDDPLYVWSARQISAHPLDFYGFTINWGGQPGPMVQAMLNPPLLQFYLAATAKVIGWNEIALHLAILPLSILSAVGMYFIACQFCRKPVVATLLMMLCPAFYVSATTLMCDVPMLCIWLWSTFFWIKGSQGAMRWLAVAGFLAGLAILTKFSAVCLLLLFIFYALITPATRRTRLAQASSLLVAVVMIAAFNYYTFVRYGQGLFISAIGFSSNFKHEHSASLPAKLLDAILFVGGGALAAFAASYAAASRGLRIAVVGIVLPLTWAAYKLFQSPGSDGTAWLFYVQAGILAAAGVSIAIICCREAVAWSGKYRRDGFFLLVWTGGVFVFAAALNWSVNARSILPLVPPVCILTQRAIERTSDKISRTYFVFVFAAAVVGIFAAFADYQFADANCWAARQITKEYSREKIWFTGHWGFQYYMEQYGATALDDTMPACKANDLVVVPLNNYGIAPRGVRLKAIDSLSVGSSSFLTLLNGPLGANFYFSQGDRLPFVIGTVPPETFVIFRVMANPASSAIRLR